jgi:hypothetical protein
MRGKRRGRARADEEPVEVALEQHDHNTGAAALREAPLAVPPGDDVRQRVAFAGTALSALGRGVTRPNSRTGLTVHSDREIPHVVPGGRSNRAFGASMHPQLPAPAQAAAPIANSETAPCASPRVFFGALRASLRALAAANAPHLLHPLAGDARCGDDVDDPLLLAPHMAADSSADIGPPAHMQHVPRTAIDAPAAPVDSDDDEVQRGRDDIEVEDLDAEFPVGGRGAMPAPRILPPWMPLRRTMDADGQQDDLDTAFPV